MLHMKIKEMLTERETMLSRISVLESSLNSAKEKATPHRKSTIEKPVSPLPEENDHSVKKRHRRSADQIDRHFLCPYPGCNKSYGSENSLNQHRKLKHPPGSPSS
eukprot:TRINITY_DN2316_c0_g2_i2.p1 TRINITY_DN2316_c0_g2~~TRINITY_DN2316_c0_g2_i2.p1  ORF type:complete len:105 (-),score=15.06 TRINITY_DN2316_c0_g2_i2:171-485(-)